MSAHDRYLQRALVLAKQNIADGGRPFGAVLVRNDEIVAESVNTFHLSGDPTAHAELNAVRDLAGLGVHADDGLVGTADVLRVDRQDRKSTRLNSSHSAKSRMPSSA